MTTPAIFHAVRSPPCVGFFASVPFFISNTFSFTYVLSIIQLFTFGTSHTSSELTLLREFSMPRSTSNAVNSTHYHSLIHSLLSISFDVFANTPLPKSILINEGKSSHYSDLKQLTLKCDLHHIHKTTIVDLHIRQHFTILHFKVRALHYALTRRGGLTETALSNPHSLQMRHVFENERQHMLETIISNCQFFQQMITGELLTAHGLMTSHSTSNRCFDCIGFEKWQITVTLHIHYQGVLLGIRCLGILKRVSHASHQVE